MEKTESTFWELPSDERGRFLRKAEFLVDKNYPIEQKTTIDLAIEIYKKERINEDQKN